ncbi:MAG: OmpA family protein [Ignavibacteriaceae bacterium]|nr:OmpA family protein [Ignavibacteriaceae bacterium]
MKNFFITLALMLLVNIGVSQAQTVTDSWAFGFGLSYPRFYSVNITALNNDYGAYLSIQRNFSEHVGLRLRGGYAHLAGQWSDASLNLIKESTNLITGDLDMLYYLVPCAPVSPYLFAGVGGNYKSITNPQTVSPDNNKFGTQLNVGVGADFKFNPSWSFVAEFGYHQTSNSELDGAIIPDISKEVNGHDSYIVLSAGLNYFFDKGKPSPQCEPCQGMTMEMKDMTDYNKIEDMIKKHIPKEVIKEIVVDKYIVAISEDRLVLVGVNFAFDKSDLLPESYIPLDKSVKLLKEKPDVNVEIEGYTDYIGTEEYNQQLSIDRAITVKNYLVSQGIAESRLSTVGFGKGNPVATNETEEGRAMNRRIVFRIINK